MSPRRVVLLLLAMLSVAAGIAADDFLIGAPDAVPSRVTRDGVLHEDWGSIALLLQAPGPVGAPSVRFQAVPVPAVSVRYAAAGVVLDVRIWRAPIWPRGVDVLQASVRNSTAAPAKARLRLLLPGNLAVGERVCRSGGRSVLGLPDVEPVRRERRWGCTGEAVAMPGWARPNRPCDPAFRNIRAGMGGVPIIYRFAVPRGSRRTLVLGLCESFWSAPGSRPLRLYVEGAGRMDVDPLAKWGRHVPGCLTFDASDANGDGRLEVVSVAAPGSPDKNPILNVIWVFTPDVYVAPSAVLRGKMSAAAEYYVDVGGEKDQLLYEPGELQYELDLSPGQSRELVFLAACAGSAVPDPATTSWTVPSMWRAAKAVWADWLERGCQLSLPKPLLERWQRGLAEIAMTRYQFDAFYAALPEPGGLDQFSHAQAAIILAALDMAGLHREAERMLRFYWERRAPKAFAGVGQREDGQFAEPSGDPRAHGFAMQTLARHALLSRDRLWAQAAWNAMDAALAWAHRHGRELPAETRSALAVGAAGAGLMADMLGLGDEAQRAAAIARSLDPQARWRWTPAVAPTGRVARAAAAVVQVRNALVAEHDRDLHLLDGIDETWLATGSMAATGLPTGLGPVSVAVTRVGQAVRVTVRAQAGFCARGVVLHPPTLGGRPVSKAVVNGRPAQLDGEGLRIAPAPSVTRVTLQY